MGCFNEVLQSLERIFRIWAGAAVGGWEVGAGETFGIQERRVAEGFRDVAEVAKLCWGGCSRKSRDETGGIELPLLKRETSGFPFGPERCS